MVGYCSTGRLKAAMPPASIMTMAITQAKTGRSMKKRESNMSAFENQTVQGLAQSRAVERVKAGLRHLPQRHRLLEGGKALPRQRDDTPAAGSGLPNPYQPGLGQLAQIAGDGALLQRRVFEERFELDLLFTAETDQGGELRHAKARRRQLCIIKSGNAISGLAKDDDVASLDGQLGDAPHEWAYMLQVPHAQPPLRKFYRGLSPLGSAKSRCAPPVSNRSLPTY